MTDLQPEPPSRPLRVVVVLDHLSGGGAERAAVDLARRTAQRHDVTLVGSREAEDGASATALRAEGLHVVTLDRTATRRAWEWAPAVREIRRHRTDIVHSHLFGSNFWGPTLRALGQARAWIAHEQTPFERSGGLRSWGTQGLVNPLVVAPFARRVLVPSTWSRDALIAHERVPAHKIRIIPNGAPLIPDPPAGERERLRAELGVAPDETAVVVSAMLRPEKGHETAIRALALAARPGVRLLIVGEGPIGSAAGTRPGLEALADELGVRHAVTFAGRREDVPAVLTASDIGLLPSYNENLPLAMLEYMAAGLPIVATDVGGNTDALRDGVDGLLVPAKDPDAMARALQATLDDPDAAAARGASARARQAAHYTWEPISRTVEAVYLEALAGRR